MGFKTVYRTLVELFPQVDTRILKAVAIEHPKDVDQAAEDVISNVIPYLASRSAAGISTFGTYTPSVLSPRPAEHDEQTSVQFGLGKILASSSESRSVDEDYTTQTDVGSAHGHSDSIPQEKAASLASAGSACSHSDSTHEKTGSSNSAGGVSKETNTNAYTDFDQLQGNIEGEELILLVRPLHQGPVQSGTGQTSESMSNALTTEEITDHVQDSEAVDIEVPASLDKYQNGSIRVVDEQTVQAVSTSSIQVSGEGNCNFTGNEGEWIDFDGPSPNDFDACRESFQVEPYIDGRKSPQVEQCVGGRNGGTNCNFIGNEGEEIGFYAPSQDNSDACRESSQGEPHVDGSPQVVPCVDGGKCLQVEPCVDGAGVEVESCLEVQNFVVEGTTDATEVGFQSELSGTPTNSCKNLKFNQDIKIDFLEDIVEAAKNNKKNLFLAMDSIINMMKLVELEEKAAEEAKEEAANATLDTLTKVEELEQMLIHAKEANDMHAGEVYGERAILATEVRELQARLISLSDERDKALAIIDEMQQSLEERLAAAEELKKTAEKQKLEEEKGARNARTKQEAIMDQVVKDSKIIQQEAEANSKLREFLMNRGRVVDTLQGEISVICQDVRLLKERFDERVPLSQSISSSQTSCILASSGSSLKSIPSGLTTEERETSKSPKEGSPTASIDGQSLKSLKERSPTSSIEGQSPKGGKMNHEAMSDDDWEFFE